MSAPSTISLERAIDHKHEGQMRSLLDELEDVARDHEAAFMAVVRAIRPGARFTVNTLRSALDAAGVPASKRGGLFGAACKQGLCAIATMVIDGEVYELSKPSTGSSANASHVKVYIRALPTPPVGGA